jgi:hypothetical protein
MKVQKLQLNKGWRHGINKLFLLYSYLKMLTVGNSNSNSLKIINQLAKLNVQLF